jgi:hypothetical protein
MVPNNTQTNTDRDLEGDACDLDDDNDGIPDLTDPCRLEAGSGTGFCDDDPDGDGIMSGSDNCPYVQNPIGQGGFQPDIDGDGYGDACDQDIDGDGVLNFDDNCRNVSNPSQLDIDKDGRGDAGDWAGGAESCDNRECYVIGGNEANCLDPMQAFSIFLNLVGEQLEGKFQIDQEIIVALFSNRLGQTHSWTARFAEMPAGSNASLVNAKGSGATTPTNPHVVNCLRTQDGVCTETNNIRFHPDQPGQYVIKVTASLPQEDPLGPNTATFTIVADVEGESSGGCAATSGSFAALALGLLLAGWRRRR